MGCLPEHLKYASTRDARGNRVWAVNANGERVLRGHEDYPLGLRWVKRAWTAFCLGKRPPKMIAGNQGDLAKCVKYEEGSQWGPKPIPSWGTWQISRFPGLPSPLSWIPLYFAVTFEGGRHFRIGAFRWDDVDGYYEFFTVATRRYPATGERDTTA